MTILTTRAGKGSPLTNNEMDANFINLNKDKLDSSSIGVSIQPYSAHLVKFATVNPTVAGLALLDDVDAAAQRTTLGLGTAATQPSTAFEPADATILKDADIGVTVQAYNVNIPTVAPGSNGNVLTSNGTKWTSAPPSGGGAGAGRLLSTTYYTTVTPPQFFVKATNNPSFIEVEVVGGGGGGGGGGGVSGSDISSLGGAGGGYSRKTIRNNELAASETITIGAGGLGGSAGGGNGTAGGTSSFGSHCSATGGAGGVGHSAAPKINTPVAIGGIGTGGNLNIRGGSGGPYGAGQPSGGSSYFSGETKICTGVVGIAAASPGGGGTGVSNAGSVAGGAGFRGLVIVREYA